MVCEGGSEGVLGGVCGMGVKECEGGRSEGGSEDV